VKKYEGDGRIPIITIEPEVARTAFLITGCTTYDYSDETHINVPPGSTVIVMGDGPDELTEALRATGVQVDPWDVRVEKMFENRDAFRTGIREAVGIVEKPDRIGLGAKETWMRDLLASDLSDRAKVVGVRIILFINMPGKNQRCNPSQKTIAKAVNRGRTWVKKGIDELVEKGWLHRESGGIMKGGTSNRYRPLFLSVDSQ
jgi:hypothetical protein